MRFFRALAFAGAVLWLAAPAWAALTATPVFPQTPKLAVVQLTNASGTTSTTFVTAGTNGSKVFGIGCSSTDSADRTLQFNIVRSSTAYLVTTMDLPIGAGSSTSTAPVNALSQAITPGLPLDSDRNPFLFLQSGDTLNVNVTVALTATKIASCWADVSDF